VTGADQEVAGGRARQTNLARSAARLNAVQALYQLAMSDSPVETVITQFTMIDAGADGGGDEPIAAADKTLFAELVRGAAAKLPQLDEMLAGCLDAAWPDARLEILLRAILRCGAYEMFSRPTVPAPVIITEYMSVADAFFDGKEPALVNAVLDRLARVLRPEEPAAGQRPR